MSASDGLSRAREVRRQTAAFIDDVRAALRTAALADVRSVEAHVQGDWVRLTVELRPWHDGESVMRVVADVEGVASSVAWVGRSVLAIRKFSGQK